MTENDFNFAEFARPIAPKGKNKKARSLLILLYVCFALFYIALFTAVIMIPQLIAILPLLLWMLVFFTWGKVSYECAVRVSAGTVTLLRLRGKKEECLISFTAKDAEVIAPYAEKYVENGILTEAPVWIDHRSDADAIECYYAVIAHEGKKATVLFDASDKIIRALYYYNKNTVKDTAYIRA